MRFDAFIGPSYDSRADSVSQQRSLNLYLEADESQAEQKSDGRVLMGAPGIETGLTLPWTPVRGLWSGLVDNLPGSTGTDLCYAVGGSKLYQIFSGGTYTEIGEVGDDVAHSPVTFSVNGGQLFITSAGSAWVYDYSGLSRCTFNNGRGTVNTAGTAITWVSGDQFDPTLVGSALIIAGAGHMISAYIDETHVTVSTSPGTLTGIAYAVTAAGGTCDWSGYTVTWKSGDRFDSVNVGDVFVVEGGSNATVASVISNEQLTLTITTATPKFDIDFQHSGNVRAGMGAFLDTYFIAVPPDSKTFYISANNDGRGWNPLDYGRKEGFPDNIASVLVDHEELWLFGSETTEIWRNTGNADFPLQRDPGGFIHQGIRAPFTAVSLANGVAWLGGDTRGAPIAWRAQGFQPTRVSTHAIESIWGSYSTCADATAYVYVEDGHQFWVIDFPTGNATWVYDATAGQWHERGWLNPDTSGDERQRQWCHAYAFGGHLVGDRANGNIYSQSLQLHSDDGHPRHYQRIAPHLSNEENWTFYSRFRLSMSSGASPTLSWSSTLAANFTAPISGSAREFGSATQYTEWRRLGRGRDRVFRVDILDNSNAIALVAAFLDIAPGNG